MQQIIEREELYHKNIQLMIIYKLKMVFITPYDLLAVSEESCCSTLINNKDLSSKVTKTLALGGKNLVCQ